MSEAVLHGVLAACSELFDRVRRTAAALTGLDLVRGRGHALAPVAADRLAVAGAQEPFGGAFLEAAGHDRAQQGGDDGERGGGEGGENGVSVC
jgi:hypothetical protein